MENALLMEWVDNELSPFLVDYLNGKPKYAREVLSIMRVDGNQPSASIDGLSRIVRARILDRLTRDTGLRFGGWVPSKQVLDPARPATVQCSRQSIDQHVMGIEITPVDGDRVQVAVRVLDKETGGWVASTDRSWFGKLNRQQWQALNSLKPDESLRGLRELPFTTAEADLIANYLANNLSCLLRQQGLIKPKIFIESALNELEGQQTLMALLGDYLSRLNEVQITERRQQAEYILTTAHYDIDAQLSQLWVRLISKGDSTRLPGVDSSVYVQRSGAKRRSGESLYSTESAVNSGPNHTASTQLNGLEETLGGSPKIVQFDLLEAVDKRACGGWEPTRYRRLMADQPFRVALGGCEVLKFQAIDAVAVILLRYSMEGNLIRLDYNKEYPGGQQGKQSVGYRSLGRPTNINGTSEPVNPGGRSGIESYYVLAIGDWSLFSRIEKLLQQHAHYAHRSGSNNYSSPGIEAWVSMFDQTLLDNSDFIDWRAFRVKYENKLSGVSIGAIH